MRVSYACDAESSILRFVSADPAHGQLGVNDSSVLDHPDECEGVLFGRASAMHRALYLAIPRCETNLSA
uniref:Uncharacterized protein n=1 Tax=Parascaris equorum TaxID=6256 RepID=A0A914S176_PAREQ